MTEEEIQVKALELSALALAALPEQDKIELLHADDKQGLTPLNASRLVIIKAALGFEEKLRHIFNIGEPSPRGILP